MQSVHTFPPMRILMLGLDAAGKTTMRYWAELNKYIHTYSSLGIEFSKVSPVKGITFILWDLGGVKINRVFWRSSCRNKQGLFFIVDSADVSRMSEAKDELYGIIKNPDMAGVPVVVVANKQDLPGALSTAEVADKLGLHELLGDRKWYIQGACSTKGEGIDEAMQTMARLATEFYNRIDPPNK